MEPTQNSQVIITSASVVQIQPESGPEPAADDSPEALIQPHLQSWRHTRVPLVQTGFQDISHWSEIFDFCLREHLKVPSLNVHVISSKGSRRNVTAQYENQFPGQVT